jgi:hypothetical protein
VAGVLGLQGTQGQTLTGVGCEGKGDKRGNVKMGGAGLTFGILTLTHYVKHGSLRKLAENVKILAAADTFKNKKNAAYKAFLSSDSRFL